MHPCEILIFKFLFKNMCKFENYNMILLWLYKKILYWIFLIILFSVTGVNVHIITPFVCIVCIFYTCVVRYIIDNWLKKN